MIVDYSSASPLTSLNDSVASAYTYGSFGGDGITSSSIGASGLYTVGVGSTSDVLSLGAADRTTWQGHTVDGTAVLVRFTYAGDANLDGTIDATDYGIVDNYVQFPGTSGFALGDFNYDGTVDGTDYGIIDNTFQSHVAVL